LASTHALAYQFWRFCSPGRQHGNGGSGRPLAPGPNDRARKQGQEWARKVGQETGPGNWARQRGYRARTCRSAPRGTGRGAASVASWAAARLGVDALAGRPRHLENRAT